MREHHYMRRLSQIILVLLLAACGGSSSSRSKQDLASTTACRTLNDYALVGIPATYLDDGAILLDKLASQFEQLNHVEISSDIKRAIELTYQGPSGQLAAKSLLIDIAGTNCSSQSPRSTEQSATIDLTEPPVSPSSLLNDFAFQTTTEIFDHACGTFALGHSSGAPTLLQWDGSTWTEVSGLIDTSQIGAERSVFEYWLNDVTGDGQPDITINWTVDGANRTIGTVLEASSADCLWAYAHVVDSCGSYGYFEDSVVVSGIGLAGTGFPGPCGSRDDVRFVWEPTVEMFVVRRSDPSIRLCADLFEDYDLPLSVCSEGWAVSMAQEALVNQGIGVDIDGQFGSGTQVGVIEYQQLRGLPVTGIVDPQTWAEMYPVDGDFYPDYDGDGVSSPREIGDRSGAFEAGDF